MARRRRSRIPRKRSNRLLMATQVIFLLGILVFILLFRDFIADGAGQMFGSFGTGDVQVQKKADSPAESNADSKAGAPSEDAGTE